MGRVKVAFRSGAEVETAWCTSLGKGLYRLDNILFFKPSPIQDDVIEAVDRAGQLTYRKVAKAGGRHAMIIDYPAAVDGAKLRRYLAKSFGVASEGAYRPRGDKPGRLYLALPKVCKARALFVDLIARFPGLTLEWPELRLKLPAVAAKPAAPALPAKQARRTAVDEHGRTALHWAVQRNQPALVKALCDRGARLEAKDLQGVTPLFMAARDGRPALVRLLLACGARADAPVRGSNALLGCAMRGRATEARLLLAAGARVRPRKGELPLLVEAAFRGHLGMVRLLLPLAPKDRNLALVWAAGEGNLAIVKLLLRAGAEPDWKTPNGNSALMLARKRKHKEIVAALAAHA